jgi:uncharacterized membrane protein
MNEPAKEVIESLADMQAEHYRALPAGQRTIERLTNRLGRPSFVYMLLLVCAMWLTAHVVVAFSHADFNPDPAWLQVALALAALMMAGLILTTENKQSEMNERRARLTLHMVLVAEQKIAKAVQLLERVREEDPLIGGPPDEQAKRMSEPTDPRSVMERLDEAHQAVIEEAFSEG